MMIVIFLSPDLQSQLANVRAENQSLRDEFNSQRAKLKELFLQKEGGDPWCIIIQLIDTN